MVMRKLFLFLAGALSMTIITAHADTLSLESSSFKSNTSIPTKYSCDGSDISPQLSWSGAPDKTQSLALILSDPDAPSGTFYHWILYNMPKKMTSLQEAISSLPAGTQIGKNSRGNMSYNGPCPPKGATHRYIFTLYALDTTLHLAAGTDAEKLIEAMQTHILGQTSLQGTFHH
jgi:Raf kinase inhibitor-like YbhB/YbcL family protein